MLTGPKRAPLPPQGMEWTKNSSSFVPVTTSFPGATPPIPTRPKNRGGPPAKGIAAPFYLGTNTNAETLSGMPPIDPPPVIPGAPVGPRADRPVPPTPLKDASHPDFASQARPPPSGPSSKRGPPIGVGPGPGFESRFDRDQLPPSGPRGASNSFPTGPRQPPSRPANTNANDNSNAREPFRRSPPPHLAAQSNDGGGTSARRAIPDDLAGFRGLPTQEEAVCHAFTRFGHHSVLTMCVYTQALMLEQVRQSRAKRAMSSSPPPPAKRNRNSGAGRGARDRERDGPGGGGFPRPGMPPKKLTGSNGVAVAKMRPFGKKDGDESKVSMSTMWCLGCQSSSDIRL